MLGENTIKTERGSGLWSGRRTRLLHQPPWNHLPLLNLVESLGLGDGNEDNDSLLAALDIYLLGGGDLKRSKLGLEVGNIGLEVEESLSNLLLDLGRSRPGRVGGAVDVSMWILFLYKVTYRMILDCQDIVYVVAVTGFLLVEGCRMRSSRAIQ